MEGKNEKNNKENVFISFEIRGGWKSFGWGSYIKRPIRIIEKNMFQSEERFQFYIMLVLKYGLVYIRITHHLL